MLKGKRGAIELSITTIVVVVIGIVLLSLGLIWVRGIFGRLGGTTGSAFDKVDAEISNIFGDVNEPVIVSPNVVQLKKGETKIATLIVANIFQPAEPSLNVRGVISGTLDGVRCLFADTLSEGSERYELKSDQQVSIGVVITDDGGDLGTYNCVIDIEFIPAPQQGGTFKEAIIIQKVP